MTIIYDEHARPFKLINWHKDGVEYESEVPIDTMHVHLTSTNGDVGAWSDMLNHIGVENKGDRTIITITPWSIYVKEKEEKERRTNEQRETGPHQ